MTSPPIQPDRLTVRRGSPLAGVAWSVLAVILMAWLRLDWLDHRLVPLTYGLPLLLCLRYRDLRLLYGMSVAFSLTAAYKALVLLPPHFNAEPWWHWTTLGMQWVNIWIVTGVVHGLLRAFERIEARGRQLEAANAELEASNEELAAREEEITRQNEELQAQAEEMEQQAEELRQQAEETELQSAELQAANEELGRRDRAMQTLLDSARWLHGASSEQEVTTAICRAAVQLFESRACAAAIVQERDTALWLRGRWGFDPAGRSAGHVAFARSFASIIVETSRTAFVRDLAERPDLELPQPPQRPFRSVLATPIWIDGRAVGALEVYAYRPTEWGADDFRIIEWLAAQAALALRAVEFQHELQMRRRQAEEASIQKTRFLAAVSHDVRTPANAICLLADLMEQAAQDPVQAAELPEMARDLRRSASSLVELVTDVLDLSRFDVGTVELQVSSFDLYAFVQSELAQHRPLAQVKGLALRCEGPDRAVWVATDRKKLARVLANLVGNAIKFTERGGVEVRVEPSDDGAVELAVCDSGIGIAADDLTRIFDEFFQLRNPERDRSKGTGLGLAICRRLVDGLGCTLRAESTPGQGSRFTLRLPPTLVLPDGPSESPGSDGPVDAAPAAATQDRALEGLRILLVEDHVQTRMAASRLLSGQGATVLQADTAAAAMESLRRDDPDVLLLDLMLPDGDGADVLVHLRRGRPERLRCVLAISGDARAERVEQIRRLGADELVPKPVTLDRLIAAIRRHLSADPHPRSRHSLTPEADRA